MTELQIIHGRLEEAALKLTDNFCYSCYKVVQGEHCPTCGTDDFMRHLFCDRCYPVRPSRLCSDSCPLDSRAAVTCL